MKLFSAMSITLATMLVFSGNVKAGPTIKLDRKNVPAGTVLLFETSKGKRFSTKIVSKTEFLNSSGTTVKKNADGNTLSNGKTVFRPHSGYRPPGARGKLSVGQAWTHKYTSHGAARKRDCRVVKKGTFKGRKASVEGAYLITCNNQRADRDLPRREEIWFSPDLFAEIAYKATWGGTSPGGFWVELVGKK